MAGDNHAINRSAPKPFARLWAIHPGRTLSDLNRSQPFGKPTGHQAA
jgi:hypothetical protein